MESDQGNPPTLSRLSHAAERRLETMLFAWGRLRSDVVAILVVLALILSNVLTVQEALVFCHPSIVG